jgi:hypothetical protein
LSFLPEGRKRRNKMKEGRKEVMEEREGSEGSRGGSE